VIPASEPASEPHQEDVVNRSNPAAEDERWHVGMPTPIGVLRIVAGPTAIVGLYHADHTPEPPPRLLGRHVPGGLEGDPDRLYSGHSGADNRADAADLDAADRASGPPAPEPTSALLHQVEVELGEYFAGLRHRFAVPVDLHGTDFQRSVWATVQGIPYGQRRSYRDIARDLGNPRMGRAIGAAVRANPVSIIVPGHRVVSSAGAVIGYAAGAGTKTALLELEAGFGAPHSQVTG
jgi:methylated-DNA-[protein]-cysteine S-methyltransferase